MGSLSYYTEYFEKSIYENADQGLGEGNPKEETPELYLVMFIFKLVIISMQEIGETKCF